MTIVDAGRETATLRPVGEVMDGNRRWARIAGFVNPSEGHRKGTGHWSLHVSGDLSLLPDDAAAELTRAETQTAGRRRHVTLAIGYDGRADIVAGIRGALRAATADSTDGITPADITAHLPGGPGKDIDLVIRTSGEQHYATASARAGGARCPPS